ncbi:uncharacterized protein LOC101856656 [Aplysia californica]|uniref:Uncharacterized protein LOC101856656 n=1 Tax=Aplysia californica TaxID=6500 RepID=A0ABM0ZZR4_APLCA|nr:uncharacterized protein LOC101856656 [Aplysia californica]
MADRHLGPTSTFIFQLTTTTTITTTAAISTTNDISNIITNDNNSIISNSIINNSINNSISNNNSSVSNIITTGGRTTTEIIIWSFLLLMITMASLLGNGLVIACVRIHHRLREEQSNMFIVNLSVTDMLSAVLIMLSSLHALAGDRWMLGPVWCDVVCAANYTLIIVSMLTLCFIALDRYMAVLHALHYHRVITPNKAAMAESARDVLRQTNSEVQHNIPVRGTHEVAERATKMGGPLSSFDGCRKHRDHEHFLSVDDFGVDNLNTLPPHLDLPKKDIVSWVKSWAALVVRIKVNVISDLRPEFWGDDDEKPYPFGNMRGRIVNCVGSSWVHSVTGPLEGPCSCIECGKLSTNKKDKCWLIMLLTARHVVYDDKEARACKIDFFDDGPDGSGVQTLKGSEVHEANTERDHCVLVRFTHDDDLGQKLRDLCEQRRETDEDLRKKLRDKWGLWDEMALSYSFLDEFTSWLPVFVISHPHGRMKYITIGYFNREGGNSESVTYTTATCPGSSGGLVLSLGTRSVSELLLWSSRWYKRTVCVPHSCYFAKKLMGGSAKLIWGWFLHEYREASLIYFSETWFKDSISTNSVDIDRFHLVMKVAQEHHEHLNSQRISSSPSYRSRTRVSCMHDELATTVHRSSTRNSLRFPESSRRQNGGVNGVEETGEEKRNQRLLEHEGAEQWSANLSNHSDPRIHHSSGARPVNAAKTANHKTDCRSPMSENGESSLELQNLRYTCGNVCPSVSSTNNSTTKPTDQNDPWQNPDKNADRGSGLSSAELLTENAAITASTTTTTSETATTKTTTSLKPQMSSEFHPESGRTLAWVENGVTGPANVFGPVKRFTVGNNYDDDDDEDDEDNTSFSGVTTSPNMLAQLGSIEGTKQLVDCAIAVAIPSYRGNMTSLWSRRVSYPKDVGSPQTDHRLRSRQWADHNSFDQRGHNQISESDVSTTSSNNPLVQPNLAWSDNTLSMSDIRCVEHEPGQGGTTTTTTTTTTIITKPNPSPSIPQPHHQNHHHHNNKKTNNNTSTQSQPSPNTPQRQLDLHDLRPLNPAYPPNHQHNEDNNTVVTDSSRASKADLSNPIDKSKVLLRTSAQQHQLQESSKISQEDPTRKRLNVTHCATATTPTTTATKTTTTPATTTTTSTQQGHTHSSPQHIAKISSTTTHKRLTGTSYNEATTLTPGSAAGSRDVTTGTTRRSPGAKDTLTRQSKQRSYSASNKAVRSLLIVVLAYFICMTPFSITKLYKVIVGRPDALPGYVNLTASLCQFCSSAINPLIYGIFRRDFQRAFLMILRRFMVRARVTERQSPDTLSYQLN